MLRRIAVLTGDDDAPGANAALRAVTRTALHYGWSVTGICYGYAGLLNGDFITLSSRSVDGIIQRGGTMLESGERSRFSTEAGQKLALSNLAEHEIDALIVIGGEAAQAGAYALAQAGFTVVGVAASVENELADFDASIGVDTALNLALDAIDHLKLSKPTDFCALLEVAGRKCGYLALTAAVASDADSVVIPEIEATAEDIEDVLVRKREHGSTHPVVVVAEGAASSTDKLIRCFAQSGHLAHPEQPMRLGHIQRKAAPNAFDRLWGTRLGAGVVDALARGEHGVLIGLVGSEAQAKPFADVIGKKRVLDHDLHRFADWLASPAMDMSVIHP